MKEDDLEQETAHTSKKRRVAKSKQTDVHAERKKLLRATKSLVKLRGSVIASKTKLESDLQKIGELLSKVDLCWVPTKGETSAERVTDVGKDFDSEKGLDSEKVAEKERLHGSDDEQQYEVREIVDAKIKKRGTPPGLYYKVRWAGYDNTKQEYSWVFAGDVEGAPLAVQEFYEQHPNKPRA